MKATTRKRVSCRCGKRATLRYSGDIGARMEERSECFDCAFWGRLLEQDAERPETVVIVEGRHYMIEPDPDQPRDRGFAGFGGAEFTVAFNDGRVVKSRNLWTQGEIPERFREQMPDNATFLHGDRSKFKGAT